MPVKSPRMLEVEEKHGKPLERLIPHIVREMQGKGIRPSERKMAARLNVSYGTLRYWLAALDLRLSPQVDRQSKRQKGA